MKGLVKGIVIGVGAIAATVGGIAAYKKAKRNEVDVEATETDEEINPEYAEIFLGKGKPEVDVKAEEG